MLVTPKLGAYAILLSLSLRKEIEIPIQKIRGPDLIRSADDASYFPRKSTSHVCIDNPISGLDVLAQKAIEYVSRRGSEVIMFLLAIE